MFNKLALTLCPVFALCASPGGSAQTPVYKLIYSAPDPSSQGAAPLALSETATGVFCFLSTQDGVTFGPSVFSLTVGGSASLIHSFQPNTISGAMAQAADGKLYGAVYGGPTNTFYYSLSLSGRDIGRYETGNWASLSMITAAPGRLYDGGGNISEGGAPLEYGFARIDGSGKVRVIHKLSSSDGVPAPNKLLLAQDGNLYGIGSKSNEESPPFFIYRLTPNGGYSQLLTFPSSLRSAYPVSLILASDGDFYGTFSNGGANDTGVIYRATLSGQWHVVASFPAKAPGSEMQNPDSLVEASDGALYGSTEHNAIFRYDLATQALTLAYQMNPHNLQGSCVPCNFIQAMDGKLYGTAAIGGPGGGAIFSLDFGLPKPKPSLAELVPPSGAVGQRVLLWGGHLLGATSVTFNGVPAAAFQVNSTQAVMATVPAGATSGPVTITTANGSVTSAQSFTIQ